MTDDGGAPLDQALELARRLYALGRALDDVIDWWGGAGERAAVHWRGPYGDEFRTMVERAVVDGRDLAADLSVEADRWAQAWADAMNQQNRQRLADHLDELRRDRGRVERLAGSIGIDIGGLVAVPEPRWIPPPVAPFYHPTGQLQVY